ncbi:MAG: HTTM domain-containing protein [Bacteroidia bacterium]
MQWIDKLYQQDLFSEQVKMFRKWMYAFLFIHTLILLPAAGDFWGENQLIQFPAAVGNWLNIISISFFSKNYFLVIILYLIMLLVGLFKPARWVHLLIWYLYINLYYNAAAVQNGGNNLVALILLYLAINNAESNAQKSPIENLLNNLSAIASRIQIAMMYGVAGIYKLTGETWINGTALMYIFNNPEYSLPYFSKWMGQQLWLIYIVTYATLAFQLLFPVLIWFVPIRKYVLWIGSLFHIAIALFMGIPDFGIIMLIMYMLFYPLKK